MSSSCVVNVRRLVSPRMADLSETVWESESLRLSMLILVGSGSDGFQQAA